MGSACAVFESSSAFSAVHWLSAHDLLPFCYGPDLGLGGFDRLFLAGECLLEFFQKELDGFEVVQCWFGHEFFSL
jgi:hypothetical protein